MAAKKQPKNKKLHTGCRNCGSSITWFVTYKDGDHEYCSVCGTETGKVVRNGEQLRPKTGN